MRWIIGEVQSKLKGCYVFLEVSGSGSQTLAGIKIIWNACYNTDFWAPTPEVLIQCVWSGVQEFAFLTSSQMMTIILVWEPHFEDLALRLLLRLHCLQGAMQCALSWRQNFE